LLFAAAVRVWLPHVPGGRLLAGPPSPWRIRDVLVALGLAGAAAALAIGLRARVAARYEVTGFSMLPTLEPGDSIAGNKLAYAAVVGSAPRRGEVVVLRASLAPAVVMKIPEFLVKRIIGIPGDRVGMRDGVPTINGWSVPTCDVGDYFFMSPGGDGTMVGGRVRVEFLDDSHYLTLTARGERPFVDTYLVGPGEAFVVGDDRGGSVDSRAWNDGHGAGVPFAALDARAEWFLSGTRRDAEPDFSRTLGPLFSRHVHLDGVDTRALDAGVERCLQDPPHHTHPPPQASEPAIGGAT
jgi:signal peptidase I